ncbi:MAG: TetR/AcrR family transcriptional regulator [Halobacteria archaeon]|nr:TetR/AcrR family transcriptional regulator [Halobacteria archaeon]
MPNDSSKDGYHHGDLRNALLSAAEGLLVQHGPGGLSLREVARVAGVSHTAPYRHFSDKAALLQALARRGFERLHAAMTDAAAGVPHGPEQQLIAAGIACVRHAVNHAEITQLMFGGTLASTVDAAGDMSGRDAFAALQTIIESGISAGVFRQREPRELALVAWTSMHGLAMLMTAGLLEVDTGNPAALDQLVGSVASNVIYGIAR